MAKVQIEVDGQSLEVEAGRMLIEATDAAGIHIPRFCYHEKLSVAANCRMCLVEVERAPKPLPACATPMMEGMKVSTQSPLAKTAQEGTMEFLLINHPLDCPICDQGGECPLQDQSVEYGANESRFEEAKRQVVSKDIGPLIATWMTRCIHCTRCVRFGEEIAGVMELGAFGRGEHTKIGTMPSADPADVDAFISSSVNSEVSGNAIELCPVGALTAKPSKYAARIWEMDKHAAISPHDCLGTNVTIETLRGETKRAVCRDNDDINQCWLSDRDRFSYEAIHSEARLDKPMIKDGQGWREVSWDTALKHAAAGIKTSLGQNIGSIGGLFSSAQTLEEHFLGQKLVRALDSNNIDHRTRQLDFNGEAALPLYVGSELLIKDFEHLKRGLVVGSNTRKEQPLLSVFMRQAVRNNQARFASLNPMNFDQIYDVESGWVVSPLGMVTALADIAVAVAQQSAAVLPSDIAQRAKASNQEAAKVAELLLSDKGALGAVILGAQALNHPEARSLQAIARWIADATGCKLALLPEANSVGATLAGAVPYAGPKGEALPAGLNAEAMIAQQLAAYILLNVEPELDFAKPAMALQAMKNASFVVQLTSFKTEEMLAYADVLLPVATFVENTGTYVNCNGRHQRSQAASLPLGESRPAWKVMRVLGNFLELDGFDHCDIDDIHDDYVMSFVDNVEQTGFSVQSETSVQGEHNFLHRIQETPLYRVDSMVRHAQALQNTRDNPGAMARLNPATLAAQNLVSGEKATFNQDGRSAELVVVSDSGVPDASVYIASGYVETAVFDGQQPITVGGNADV